MLFSINDKDSRPIYVQITNQIKEQVRKGILKPGDELPSVRELADSLGINMHTVRGAYLKLRDQGIISLRLGRRARIARLNQQVRTADMEAALQEHLDEIITDAFLMGLSAEDFGNLVKHRLEQIKED
jgi:GntR family transcriptional regulator